MPAIQQRREPPLPPALLRSPVRHSGILPRRVLALAHYSPSHSLLGHWDREREGSNERPPHWAHRWCAAQRHTLPVYWTHLDREHICSTRPQAALDQLECWGPGAFP